MGSLVASALKQKGVNRIRLVVGDKKGLGESRTEPPEVIFIYLWVGDQNAMKFCQEIRSMPETRYIPVIVWGAMAPEEIYPRLQDAGATGYLHQPCTPDDIFTAYDAAINGENFHPAGDISTK